MDARTTVATGITGSADLIITDQNWCGAIRAHFSGGSVAGNGRCIDFTGFENIIIGSAVPVAVIKTGLNACAAIAKLIAASADLVVTLTE